MKRLLLLLTILGISGSAYAQEPKPNKVPLVHDGRTGVWIESETIKLMAVDLQDYKLLKDQYVLLAEKVKLLATNVDLYKELAESRNAEITIWRDSSAEEKKRADAAVREAGRWYRAPYLWAAVGVAVGLGAVYVGAQATK